MTTTQQMTMTQGTMTQGTMMTQRIPACVWVITSSMPPTRMPTWLLLLTARPRRFLPGTGDSLQSPSTDGRQPGSAGQF